jgi:hypothetical protein
VCDDGMLPVICPTCQMPLQNVQVIAIGPFAWGCF